MPFPSLECSLTPRPPQQLRMSTSYSGRTVLKLVGLTVDTPSETMIVMMTAVPATTPALSPSPLPAAIPPGLT